jgi:uncharacterized membrane protein YccC
MLPIFMKRASLGALLIAVFVSTSPDLQRALLVIICLAACAAFWQSLQWKEYGWASLFAAVAVVFNPFFPLPLPYGYAVILNFLCLGLFGSSLVYSQARLRAPVASPEKLPS